MAGGEGTRLRPLTSNQPKPMVPIFNQPVMEYIIKLLKLHNITDVVATLQFLPQMIKNYFGDGSDLGVYLRYTIEQNPLGTAGSVKNAEEFLNTTFIVVSGDALTDFDLNKIIKFHKKKHSLATIALKRVENPLEFGVVITDDEGRIERFLEKPTWGEVFSDTINTGIYVLEPEVFDYIPKDKMVDFSKDVFPRILADGKPIYGYVTDGYWCDIGNYEQYMKAHQEVMQGISKINPPGIKMRDDVWIGEGAYIHPSVDLNGPVVIGQNTRVEEGSFLGKYTVVGNNVLIGPDTHIQRSIIWDNAYIGSQSNLHGCVIGRGSDIKRGARVEQGVVVGDECVLGENTIINHDVKIYPFKKVEAGATVNSSIIWETKGMRSLFGQDGVSGLVGIDITPDIALHLAMAYGTALKNDGEVMISSDISTASRMIKRAMISGLNSTGISCRDLRSAPATINRFNTRISRCIGGIHIRVSPFDPQSLQINFFDAGGLDITEGDQRNIERYYFRGDYRRAYYRDIGKIIFPARSWEYYIDGLLRAIDYKMVSRRRFKVIVDYTFGSSSQILPGIISKLGCDVVALNAYNDENRLTLSREEFDLALASLAQTVKLFKADFGVMIDSAAEKIYLIDDKGSVVSTNKALLLFTMLISRHETAKGKIAVPITATHKVEEIAGRYGRGVLKSKNNLRSMMEAGRRRDVIFVGSEEGGYIFPKFLPAYDALISFCKLLEMLTKEGRPLSSILADLPAVVMAQNNTFCPWEKKGLVMRKLIERAKGKKAVLKDGVKVITDNGWTLVLPDQDEPIFRVYAEAKDMKTAKRNVAKEIKYINSIIFGT
ncbi:MAG TPA: mannose-1-phosphate guanyltransferase [Actinobacteria bacterium]|nr:mannose-1-phosphate guanyltransferase [Actinomycetes bacterium]HEX21144.1 mannose-1-phosphate guanyltransferase [Actinomycetota bacterium]